MDWDLPDRVRFTRVYILFADVIQSAFKELLEKKHLYQKIDIQWPSPEILQQGSKELSASGKNEEYWLVFAKLSQGIMWLVTNPNQSYEFKPQNAGQILMLPVTPPTVRIYCQKCEEVNPFNFHSGSDVFENDHNYSKNVGMVKGGQVFVLQYQCQNCKLLPEVFLVQRDHLRLSLAGRAPMEKVVVPKYIPKSVEKYYSGAVIAFNSGQILPAKFMLRVFLEQLVRDVSDDKKTTDIDRLFAEYKSTLPEDFKQRFPSLETIYAGLSEHIHSANETPDLFNSARDDIDRHFDAKRLYRL